MEMKLEEVFGMILAVAGKKGYVTRATVDTDDKGLTYCSINVDNLDRGGPLCYETPGKSKANPDDGKVIITRTKREKTELGPTTKALKEYLK